MTGVSTTHASTNRTYALDRQHVFHSWSAQATLDPMVIDRASGSYLWDASGKKYLDFSSQLVYTNLGHQHPRLIQAIVDQAQRLCTVAPAHATSARSEAARLIAERTPGDLNRIFFTNGGADANEHALRMARQVTGRPKVLTAYRSYHGGTTQAMHMSGDPRRFATDTGAAAVAHFFAPYLYRSPFSATTADEECSRALEHLASVIELEGPTTVAAVTLESVPGSAGVLVPPQGYLAGVRALCNHYGIVLIADEVMCGFGRTGAWFDVTAAEVVPDLMTFAKGVNSGTVPLGGVALNDTIADYFSLTPYPGGLTYSGHPLATAAAAAAAISIMDDEGTIDQAARVGRTIFGPQLQAISQRHPAVGEARGLGVMWALELVADPHTRQALHLADGGQATLDRFAARLRHNGLLPMMVANRLHVMPPCNISDSDAMLGLDMIDEALTVVDDFVG